MIQEKIPKKDVTLFSEWSKNLDAETIVRFDVLFLKIHGIQYA